MEARGYLIIILREAQETETTTMFEERTIPYGQLVPTLNALEMITNKETDSKKKKNTKRKTMTFLFGAGEENKTKTKMKKAILLFLFASTTAIAQVGINTSTPDASAALDVESTTGGFLPPRMTQEQREAISNPANGLIVYQTDETPSIYVYSDNSWIQILNSTQNPSNIHGIVNVTAGNSETWVVPQGVFNISVIANGSQGGSSGQSCSTNLVNGCSWPASSGSGGGYGTITYNYSVVPGQTFVLTVGNDGVNGTNGIRSDGGGTAGTDGGDLSISVNGNVITQISGGAGGTAGTYPCSSCAPGAGTNGSNGSVSYTSGQGLLNVQTDLNSGFYGLNSSSRIRIEY